MEGGREGGNGPHTRTSRALSFSHTSLTNLTPHNSHSSLTHLSLISHTSHITHLTSLISHSSLTHLTSLISHSSLTHLSHVSRTSLSHLSQQFLSVSLRPCLTRKFASKIAPSISRHNPPPSPTLGRRVCVCPLSHVFMCAFLVCECVYVFCLCAVCAVCDDGGGGRSSQGRAGGGRD